MKKAICICISGLFLFSAAGCSGRGPVNREELSGLLRDTCKKKYQAYVSCRATGDTLWVYLPYAPARSGYAVVKESGNDLYLDYVIKSFNPFRVQEPNELRFLTQKVLGEIRGLFLRSVYPYKFFVLVTTDISSQNLKYEDWHIGYLDDIKKYNVGRDFSGEGFDRLAWYPKKIELSADDAGRSVPQSLGDVLGKHVDYHEITLKEFIERQIESRVYHRFTVNYNMVPFDLTELEKQEEILNIVKTVLVAYNFKGFDKLYLKDLSPRTEMGKMSRDYSELSRDVNRLSLDLDTIEKLQKERQERLLTQKEVPYYIGCLLKELEEYRTEEGRRKPAF